jgi:hypothetical protein
MDAMRLALLVFALAGALAAQAPQVSRAQAGTFHEKLLVILQQASAPAPTPRRTMFTEGEVNSYLQFRFGETLPVGVTEPSVSIIGQGRLGGRAVVDLDVVRKAKSSGGWFDPMAYLTGRLPVTATGVLTTKDGTGQFQLESAYVSGVPIPKTFLQEIVTYYTRNDQQPEGIRLDQAFELPAKIQRIDVEPGRAVVLQ